MKIGVTFASKRVKVVTTFDRLRDALKHRKVMKMVVLTIIHENRRKVMKSRVCGVRAKVSK